MLPSSAHASLEEKMDAALMSKKSRFHQKTLQYIGMVIFGLIAFMYLTPLLWLFDVSFRPRIEIFQVPPKILQAAPWVTFRSYSFDSFKLAFQKYQVGQGFLNSVFVTACGVVVTLLVCSLAAYAFAFLKFKGREIIFLCILSTMMLPMDTLLAPMYRVLRTLGLFNKHLGLILLYGASAFGVFLIRQFYVRLPISLIEAAVMDGASKLRIWWQIILPLSKPALSALAIYQFRLIWNDFLIPMIVLRNRALHTLPIKLQTMDSITIAKDYDAIMATGFLAVFVPIVFFLIYQRQFMEGLSGSVKG